MLIYVNRGGDRYVSLWEIINFALAFLYALAIYLKFYMINI